MTSPTAAKRLSMSENLYPDETLVYRIAARMFESAFAACERLDEAHQQLLLREIGKRIVKKISPAAPETVKPIQVIGVEIKKHNPTQADSTAIDQITMVDCAMDV